MHYIHSTQEGSISWKWNWIWKCFLFVIVIQRNKTSEFDPLPQWAEGSWPLTSDCNPDFIMNCICFFCKWKRSQGQRPKIKIKLYIWFFFLSFFFLAYTVLDRGTWLWVGIKPWGQPFCTCPPKMCTCQKDVVIKKIWTC